MATKVIATTVVMPLTKFMTHFVSTKNRREDGRRSAASLHFLVCNIVPQIQAAVERKLRKMLEKNALLQQKLAEKVMLGEN